MAQPPQKRKKSSEGSFGSTSGNPNLDNYASGSYTYQSPNPSISTSNSNLQFSNPYQTRYSSSYPFNLANKILGDLTSLIKYVESSTDQNLLKSGGHLSTAHFLVNNFLGAVLQQQQQIQQGQQINPQQAISHPTSYNGGNHPLHMQNYTAMHLQNANSNISMHSLQNVHQQFSNIGIPGSSTPPGQNPSHYMPPHPPPTHPITQSNSGPSKFMPLPTVPPAVAATTNLPISHLSMFKPFTPYNIKSAENIDYSRAALDDFEFQQILGTGTFGRVRLCLHKSTKKYFCMKILNKARIVRLKQTEHTNNEKDVLMSISHPFVVKLFRTFQDKQNIFFLMEFVPGGELFNYIRRAGRLPNEVAKICAAEIVLAMEHLHSKNILYRDLKPENILISETGHIKLTDFGFSKRVADRTFSMCGTPEYIAPEIILSKGHGKSVDWWSLGILIYELLSGCPPFTTDKDCKHAVDVISSGRLEFPSYFDPRAVDLIKRLLTIDPSERLGSSEDAEEIKRHPWFEGLDWAKIVRKEHPGPLADLKCFKLHFGKNVADSATLADEMSRAGPSKTASFEGFEGFRTIR